MGVRGVICAAALLWPTSVAAQEAVEIDGPALRPSGEAYLDATDFRGLRRGVAYFDPTRPPPPLETEEAVPPAGEEEAGDGVDVPSDGLRWGVMVVAGAILAVVLYAVWASGGRFAVSLSRDPEDGGRPRARTADAATAAVPASVEAILAMTDRKAALVQLCRALLARVVGAEGVLLDRSWTDRDTLRRVPRAHPQRAALQSLVFASERVQFGGRDVAEEEFRAHLDRLSPLWTRA